MDLEIGSTIGDYQVLGILGAGGMGKVYKVRNLVWERIEAMKVLVPDLAGAPDLADRYVLEIKVQASLEHPNIASLHTALRLENRLLLLMEFVEGQTLEQRLREGPLTVPQTVDYVGQVLAALEYVHAHGVVHRGVKPCNIMLTPAGLIKLMDFGMSGTAMGSPYYMSPEQIQGSPDSDARSDLYSVGVSLYELLTGKRPFDGDNQFAILSAHLKNTPVPPIDLNPRLPRALNDVILLSVARDPNARFQSAGDFRNALASAARAEAPAIVSAPDSSPQGSFPLQADVSPAQARSQRALWMTMGGVAAALAVVAAIQFGPWRATKAAPEPPPTASPAAAAPAPVPAPVPSDAQAPVPPTNPLSTPEAAPAPAVVPGVAQPAQRPLVPRPNPRPTQNAGRPAPGSPGSGATTQQAPAAAAGQAAAPAAHAGPDPEAIEAAGEKFDMLQARAASLNTSLQTFERSLAASGMNLRGDMQNAHNLMNTYMSNASEALRAGDLNSAKNNMEKAEMQIGMLERFLNR
jgi:serine/threonine-protein kinase